MKCLNPCFSGRWFRSLQVIRVSRKWVGLNPCFSGRWFRRRRLIFLRKKERNVLILVLVEDGFGADIAEYLESLRDRVLILVLVEDGFGVSH